MIYRTEFEHVARQALSFWNREPSSPSFGSFDRAWWGWKKKDFPDATLQYGVKLAVEYARRKEQTANLPDWLSAYVRFCGQIQLRDGSFDQVYPYERSPGVVYDILSTLIYVRQSPFLQGAACSELDGIIARAVAFAVKNDERHGEIANHLAEYAFELFYAGARDKGQEYLERTLRLFDPEEGWFQEYQGPDPGYQTRTLRYLTKTAELLEDDALWGVVEKAARFVGHALMPDGSLHPMLGVRSTAVLYPAAFEKLARRDAAFAPLAARVRKGWEGRKVPLPSTLDFENAMRLADDALEAADVAGELPAPQEPTGRVELPRAGLVVDRSAGRSVHVAVKLGGAAVIYHGDRLVHEDAGYLLETNGVYLTRMPEGGEPVGPLKIRTRFYASLHDELDPLRFVALRVLNLSFLRVGWIGELFKKVVVKRLMTGRRALAVTLEREVALTEQSVVISDEIQDHRKIRPARERLWRCRRLVGTHMASSRYFQEQELEGARWTEPVDWEPGTVLRLRHEITRDDR